MNQDTRNNGAAFADKTFVEVSNAMTCFECGRPSLHPDVVQLPGVRNGETFVVKVMGVKCGECGFETIDSTQSAEFTRLVSDEYRKAHGLLTGAEIRACRAHLGMTQLQFAEYLGTGVASVKRWESGQIQDKALDELIRLKTDPGTARKNLRTVELQVPEPLVLFEGEDVSLTLAMSETQYVQKSPMKMGVVSIPEENFMADACIAA